MSAEDNGNDYSSISDGAGSCSVGSGTSRGFALSSCSRKERIALAVSLATVVLGISVAALSSDRSGVAAAEAPPAHQASCPTTGSAVATVAPSVAASSAIATTPASAASSTTAATATATSAQTSSTTRRRTATPRQGATSRPASPRKPAPVVSSTAPTARGLTVSFGSYEGAPLKWRVLSESGDDLLLISEHVVSAGAFQSDWERDDANRYRTSEVRTWLLGQFATSAFSVEESAALLPHAGGTADGDRVFLLSAAEATRYLGTAASRRATPRSADSADDLGFSGEALALTGGWAGWWLADSANGRTSARFVRADGTIASQLVYYADLGVRPAIRVDRDAVGLALSGTGVK